MHTEYGHLGHPRLLGVVTGRGWWHGLEKDIREYIKVCPQCQIAQEMTWQDRVADGVTATGRSTITMAAPQATAR
jgi:Integrase zinc binding domain